MKKFITLLMAAASVTSLMAQSQTTEEAKRIILGERRDNRTDNPNSGDPRDIVLGRDGRPVYEERRSTNTSRNRSIDQVNREYDAKIRSIRNNPTLTREEKDRIIRGLEYERNRRIREINGNNRRDDDVYRKGNGKNNRDYRDDDYYKKDKKHKNKGNNGKHLGWQKGKGNPHRN